MDDPTDGAATQAGVNGAAVVDVDGGDRLTDSEGRTNLPGDTALDRALAGQAHDSLQDPLADDPNQVTDPNAAADQGGDQGGAKDETDYIIQAFQISEGNARDVSATEIREALGRSDEYEGRVASIQASLDQQLQTFNSFIQGTPFYENAEKAYRDVSTWLERNSNEIAEPSLELLSEEGGSEKYIRAKETYDRQISLRNEAKEHQESLNEGNRQRAEQIDKVQREQMEPVFKTSFKEIIDPKHKVDIAAFLNSMGLDGNFITQMRDPRMVGLTANAYRHFRAGREAQRALTAKGRGKPPTFVRGARKGSGTKTAQASASGQEFRVAADGLASPGRMKAENSFLTDNL